MALDYFPPPPPPEGPLSDDERQKMLLSTGRTHEIFTQFYRQPNCELVEHLRSSDWRDIDPTGERRLYLKNRTVDFLNQDWPSFQIDCLDLVKSIQLRECVAELVADCLAKFIFQHQRRFEIVYLLEMDDFIGTENTPAQRLYEIVASEYILMNDIKAVYIDDLFDEFSGWLLKELELICIHFDDRKDAQEQTDRAGDTNGSEGARAASEGLRNRKLDDLDVDR